jgi:hypothetical protein
MSLATWEEVEEIARKKREAEAAALAEATAAAMAEPEPVVEETPEVVAEVVTEEPERKMEVETDPTMMSAPVRRTRRGV